MRTYRYPSAARALVVVGFLLAVPSPAGAVAQSAPAERSTAPKAATVVDPPADKALTAPLRCARLQPIVVASRVVGCTHGPDPAPPGIDFRIPVPLQAASSEKEPARATALAEPRVPCYGDGTDGMRTQAIYAYPADRADRYSTVAPNISRWAAEMDGVVDASAGQTGGSRHVRFVTDAACNLVIQKVQLSALGDDNFTNTEAELAAQGFTRSDRKYLVWMDSTVLCGVAGYYMDDRPTLDNVNNGTGPGLVARIDSGCWGLASQGQSVEAHEMAHVLGGVQPTAPHATELGHCDDESDRLCYDDGSPGLVLRTVCPASNEAFLDCKHDDYFSTNAAAGTYLNTHWNTARSSFLATSDPVTAVPPPPPPTSTPAPQPQPPPGPLDPIDDLIPLDPLLPDVPIDPVDGLTGEARSRFQPLTPARVVDTRTGNGGRSGRLGTGSFDAPMAGRGGVSPGGVAGVVLNVTVTQGTAASTLTVYPTGDPQPPAPNLRFAANQTRPNLAFVPLGTDGRVRFANSSGSVHVIADVVGWFDDDGMSALSRFSSLTPNRILDTRTGTGAPRAMVGGPAKVRLQVTGRGGVPSAGVAGVLVNVTVTNPTTSSFLTIYPSGAGRPLASALNFVANQTVPNLVFVAVGSGGGIDIYNALGRAHVIADVVGWLDNGSNAARSDFKAVTPAALLDTRNGTGGRNGALGPGETVRFQAAGRAGVPSSGVVGVALNVSALNPSAASFLTVYPGGQARPLASNLNFLGGQSTANVVVVPVGSDGTVTVYNPLGSTHVRADVLGFLDDGG